MALDVDNTLTGHGSQELSKPISMWLEEMHASEIKMGIVSNNVKARVAPFAQKLGMEYTSFSCKPLPNGLVALRKKWGIKRAEMALVGDQIYTDALAAALYGVTMLLVVPLSPDTKASIRFKRRLEKPVLLRYYKKGGKLW